MTTGYRFVPTEEDLAWEEEVLHNPFTLKAWLQYIAHKEGSGAAAAAEDVDVLYERALRHLPGSYKLWAAYLNRRVRRVTDHKRPRGRATEAVVAVFERALVNCHKFPRVWLEYLRFLAAQGCVTRTRHVVDRAIRALPLGQHAQLWDFYLSFVASVAVPAETRLAALRRYVLLEPGAVEDLVDALLEEGRFGEAAERMARLVEDPQFASRRGKSRQRMWSELCDVLVKHPREAALATGLDVDAIIRSGIARQLVLQQKLQRQADKQKAKEKQSGAGETPAAGGAEIAPPEQHKPQQQLEQQKGAVGDLWAKLAEYYVRMHAFDKARDVFEEAIGSVASVSDFAVVWDAYTQFEDQLISQTMALHQEEEDEDEGEAELTLLMARYETLLERHALLINSVLLRQNPHNVHEWFKRVRLVREKPELLGFGKTAAAAAVEVYTEALRTVDPKKAVGKPHLLWAAFARFYDENGYYEQACKIFEKGLTQQLRYVDDLASLWCDFVEMEIKHDHGERARELCKRATARPPADDPSLGPPSSAQRWVHRSIKLWALYADVEENYGTFESTKAVYEYAITSLRVATPQMVLCFAQMLEERGYFEESFKAFERGVNIFGFPHATPIWITYLTKFVARYGGRKLERARDLFEQVLRKVPEKDAKVFFVMYANLEEEHGLARHAMAVYDRATREVAEEDRYAMYLLYISRAREFFGVLKTREIYERAISQAAALPERDLRDCCLRFAALERKLGEIDRARAIYTHAAQFNNPATEPRFWEIWREFEVQHGNDDTFRDMLRVRRSVQATYNTQVSVAVVEMLKAAQDAEKAKHQAALLAKTKRQGSAMEQLELQAKEEDATEATAAAPAAAEPRRRDRIEFARGSEPATATTAPANPEEMDLDAGEEEEVEEMPAAAPAPSSSGKRKKGVVVEEMPVPEAVFGGLKQQKDDGQQQQQQLGALERLRRAGRA